MPSDFTWADVPNNPGVPLPQGPLEPLNFKAAKDLDRIVVDLGDGDEICAWRDGAFRGSFAGFSSMDGDRNVSLYRAGGWGEQPPKVIPKVATPVGPVTPVPALQSKTTQSGKAAAAVWNTSRVPSTMNTTADDYSGNSYSSLLQTLVTIPSRLNGKSAPLLWSEPSHAYSNPYTIGLAWTAGNYAALNIVGDVSFMGWVCRSSPVAIQSQYQYLYAFGDFTAPNAEASNTTLAIGVGASTPNLFTYWQSGPARTGEIVLSSLGTELYDDKWHFLTVRRDSVNKLLRFGIDKTFDSKPYTLNPTGGSNCRPNLGRPPAPLNSGYFVGNAGFLGACDNPGVWPHYLSDADVLAQYAATGGV